VGLVHKEKIMKPSALLVAAAIAIVPAIVVAKDQHSAASKSQGYGYAYAPMDRSKAIQTCNAEAAKWSYRDFQSTQLTAYRDCMFRHGQPVE
jgi:hypothetical protein